jgi:hypothetical protein
MRRMIPLAAAVMFASVLAIAAIGADPAAAVTLNSTSFAGYTEQGGGTTAGTPKVAATFKVPKLSGCGAKLRAIDPNVGIYNGSNKLISAGLFVGCSNGKAHYWPSLVVNGNGTNYRKVHAHRGDTIALHVSLSSSKASAWVVDKTRNLKRSAHGAGSSGFSSPYIGDSGWFVNNNLLGVPNFGTLRFRRCVGVGGGAARVNRRTSGGTLQIKTGAFSNSTKAFSTVFKHS